MKLKITLGILSILLMAHKTHAQDIMVTGKGTNTATEIQLAASRKGIDILVDNNDYEVVRLSAGLFAQDIARASHTESRVINNIRPAGDVVIAGTMGKSKLISQLIAGGKLKDLKQIKGHWEASLWQIVSNPFPGIKKALVIVGSDRRGTAYGLMQLSKKIGVSPWHWWADVPVAKRNNITITLRKAVWDEPAVKYRGIFINDEDWGINQWARKTFEKDFGQGVGPRTYEKVFELMLRLRLNYLWPAMHEVSKEFGETVENVVLADKYGIVAGSSHCEPMLYNNVHWDEKTKGRWNYSTNRDTIYNIWKTTAIARKGYEAVWTVGIRGIHDRGMEAPPSGIADRIKLLDKVFADQRSLIDQYVTKQYGPVAQSFVPYKEVLPIYDAGLKVPEDVTLMWVDDNFGYIRRLSNPDERKRSGGSGLYWHLSYYGSPHSYTWINTTSPALMWEEFHKAWENQARNIWVINVGDIKPMELGIDYFSRLSWSPETQGADAQPKFLSDFLAEHFEQKVRRPLSKLLTEFYRLGTVRKPEMMNRDWVLSLSDKEAEQLKTDYEGLLSQEAALSKLISPDCADAYTEMIGFPIRILAASGLIFVHERGMIFGQDKSNHQVEIERLKSYIDSEVNNYNNNLADGKWQYMMPGAVTAKNLPAWNSQVAWPWGETKIPDTSNREKNPIWARDAASADRKTKSGETEWSVIAGLGGSGHAVVLSPVNVNKTFKPTDVNAPTLEYNISSEGVASTLLIDFMPTFRIYPGMQLRVAIGIDQKLLAVVEVPGSDGKEDENGPNRNQGIRNNYVRASVNIPELGKGPHKLFIRAVDAGVVIDKLSFTAK